MTASWFGMAPFDERCRCVEDWPCWRMNPELFKDMRVFEPYSEAALTLPKAAT